MKKQEKKNLKLADGRKVLFCGLSWDDEAREKNGFKIRVDVMGRFGRNRIEIVKVFNPVGNIVPPLVQVLEKDLWTKNLLAKVIEALKQDGKGGKKLEYIVSKVAGAFKKKELILPNGDVLIDDLNFTFDRNNAGLPAAYNDLLIWGDIKHRTGKIIMLTIRNLYTLDYPGSDIKLSCKKNKLAWCKDSESLVVDYLKTLAYFSSRELSQQILEVADQLAFRSEWAVKCRQLTQKLLKIGPDDREDERIKQAFALIEEVAGAGK